MRESVVREWKKVFESDLQYITYELREMVKPPAMIILEGDLGAGKTTFAKSFVDDGNTLSPSYSVISETQEILHADFYRIESREEIIHLELPLYFENKKYLLIEWGKKHFQSITKELPEDYQTYMIEISINSKKESPTGADGVDEAISTPESRNFVLSQIFDD